MKVIFLDVDGVLNNWYTEETAPSGATFVEDYLVKNLAAIVRQTGAKVVLSSSWRYEWEDTEEKCSPDFIALRDKLASYGVELLDKTPLIGNGIDRNAEIKAWLAAHTDLEIEKYVAIDDEAILFKTDNSYLIKTAPSKGLTWVMANMVGASLNEEEKYV